MKKILLLATILTLAVFAFAGIPRPVFWQMSTTPGAVNILDYVDTPQGYAASDPDFLLEVVCSEYPTESYNSGTPTLLSPLVYWSDLGAGPMAWAYCDQQAWAADWPVGSTLTFTLTYIPTGLSESNTFTVPAGGDAIFWADLLGTTPGTWLLPDTMFPTGPTDTYNYHIPLMVNDAAYSGKGKATWQVTGPAGAYDVVAGTQYMVDAIDVTANPLVGDYTIATAPAGWHWEPTVTQTAGEFVLQTKADFHYYAAQLLWTLVQDPVIPTYTVYMSTNPVGYITPTQVGPFEDETLTYGTYTPTDVSTTGFWTPASLTIDADTDWVADGANWKFEQVFTWTEVDYYNYYLTLNVDDTVMGGTKAAWMINGYEVTAGTPFPLQSLNNTVPENPLDVDYTIEAAPDGYEWLPMVTQNAEFNLQTKGVFGYSGSLTWLLAPMANSYRVIVQVFDGINYLPGYNFTGPVSGTTPYTSPGTADYTTLLGNYTVTSAAPAGWLWVATVYTDLDDIADFAQDPNNPSLWTAYVTFFLQEDPGITPVELSSFTATLTGQFYVQLSWTSQTETQMMGYRVYRNTSAEQSTSELIDNPMIPATNTSSTQNYTVVDNDVLIGQTYYYWLEAVDYNSSSFHGPVSVTVTGNVPPVLPEVTTMRNAYPNPFKANGSTNIEVSLKAGDTGTLTIYNVQGQLVKTVSLTEGNHMVNWNGRDSRGNACGSGIYFYKLSTQSMNQTKKMVIVK